MNTTEKKTILLVEDEAIIAALEARILQRYDYQVIIANSGETAIEMVANRTDIDLILMDINLGNGMDGTRAAELILQNHNLPLIFLSSHTEREVVEKTEGITSYGYIVKDSGETVLMASIKMAFRLYESRMKEQENDIFRKRLFESSRVPIVVMDSQTFNYIDCNQAAVSIYEFQSLEETLTKTLFDVSAPCQYDNTPSTIKAQQYIDTAIAQGQEVFEWRHQCPDGELWDAEVHLMSFYSKDKLYLQFTLKDITESKKAEKTLRESEARYKALFISTIEGILIADLEGKNFRYANPALCKMFGYTESEILKLGVKDIHPKESLNQVLAEFDAQGRGEKKLAQDLPCLRKDGTVFYADINTTPIVLDGRNYNMGFFNDITKRKQIEQIQQIQLELAFDLNTCNDLQQGLEKVLHSFLKLEYIDCGAVYMTSAADGSLDLITHSGLSSEFAEHVSHLNADSPAVHMLLKGEVQHGTFADINPVHDAICEKEGLCALTAIPIMDKEQLIAILNLASRSLDSFPKEILLSLETITFQISGALLRLHTDAALQESEEIFKQFMDNSPIYVFFKDDKIKSLKLSRNYEQMLGKPIEDLLGKTMDELFPSEVAKAMVADDLRILKEGKQITVEEELNGRYYRTIKFPIHVDGKPRYLSGYTFDITEQKKAEEELIKSEEKYHTIVDMTEEWIWEMDISGKHTFSNPRVTEILGYSIEEFMEMGAVHFMHLDDRKEVEVKLPQHIAKKSGWKGWTIRWRHKDGNYRYLESNAGPILDKNGNLIGFRGTDRDITDRIMAEEEIKSLLQEKTVLLKEVHHRIKNNLNSIEGLLTLQSQSINNKEALSLVKDAISRVQSMRVLYDNLLISENYTDISSKNYFEKLISTIIALYPNAKNISIEKNISDFIVNSKVILPIGIIINELITNAMKYAFSEKEQGILQINITMTNHKISIIIADNGIGLPAKFIKEENKGFGFMLVDMLIKQINGSIILDSSQGTKYIIECPY